MMYAQGQRGLILDFLACFARRIMERSTLISDELLRQTCADACLSTDDYPVFTQQVGMLGCSAD